MSLGTARRAATSQFTANLFDVARVTCFNSRIVHSHHFSSRKQPNVTIPENRNSVLVRDFIEDSLYNPDYGYFAAHDVVGSIGNPIDFKALAGRQEYQELLQSLYGASRTSWLTPIEIFKPWYGYALAEYIIRQHKSTASLQIFELGGGMGTCAVSIMDYLKQHANPSLYKDMTYTSVEISASLAKHQLAHVATRGEHAERFSVKQLSALDAAAWGPSDDSPCFVIALEVLDNLPHDRLWRESPWDPWQETCVVSHPEQPLSLSGPTKLTGTVGEEVLRPLQDPLIMRCLEAMEEPLGAPTLSKRKRTDWSAWMNALPSWFRHLAGGPQVTWLPTSCLRLLELLHEAHPNMILLAADFSFLPDVRVEGVNAPLVAGKRGAITKDYHSYLVEKGSADIFFPTDFRVLQRLDHFCHHRLEGYAPGGKQLQRSPRASAIVNTNKFMERYAAVSQTATRQGFNPLLHDYSNTKIYISTPC